MKDIHSHILFSIDDGARDLDASVDILREMSIAGYTDIVLTPHYIIDSKYSANNEIKELLLKRLKRECERKKIKVNLYLGNEVYLDDGLIDLLDSDIRTINNSKYILVEFSLHSKNPLVKENLNELIKIGLTPIIAHPERYSCYESDYTFFEELIEMGCILQGNIGSLFNKYGKNAKKMLKGLLERGMITVMGSDIHHLGSTIDNKLIEKELLKVVKKQDKVNDLIKNNIDKIIKNKDI